MVWEVIHSLIETNMSGRLDFVCVLIVPHNILCRVGGTASGTKASERAAPLSTGKQ